VEIEPAVKPDTMSTREALAEVVPILRAKGYDWDQTTEIVNKHGGFKVSVSTVRTYDKQTRGKRRRRSRPATADAEAEKPQDSGGDPAGEDRGEVAGDESGAPPVKANEQRQETTKETEPAKPEAVRPGFFPKKVNLDDL
jgi:hypothetical protein